MSFENKLTTILAYCAFRSEITVLIVTFPASFEPDDIRRNTVSQMNSDYLMQQLRATSGEIMLRQVLNHILNGQDNYDDNNHIIIINIMIIYLITELVHA